MASPQISEEMLPPRRRKCRSVVAGHAVKSSMHKKSRRIQIRKGQVAQITSHPVTQDGENALERKSARCKSDSKSESKSKSTSKSKCKWTDKEVEALEAGVAEYGSGRWRQIQLIYGARMNNRSNVDMKDKWRNLNQARERERDHPCAQNVTPVKKSIQCPKCFKGFTSRQAKHRHMKTVQCIAPAGQLEATSQLSSKDLEIQGKHHMVEEVQVERVERVEKGERVKFEEVEVENVDRLKLERVEFEKEKMKEKTNMSRQALLEGLEICAIHMEKLAEEARREAYKARKDAEDAEAEAKLWSRLAAFKELELLQKQKGKAFNIFNFETEMI